MRLGIGIEGYQAALSIWRWTQGCSATATKHALLQQINFRADSRMTEIQILVGITLLSPKFPAGSNYSAKYTTIDREQDASNKSCILTSQKQRRASRKFGLSRTRQLCDTRSCFDSYSSLVSGLIIAVEIEDQALITSTQATNAIGCEGHNDCHAVPDDVVVLHLQYLL